MSEEIKASKDNKINDNNSLKDLIYKADLTAIVVVGLAVALLLIVTGVVILRNTENNAPKEITINYTFRVDSNYLKTIRDSTSFEYSKYIQQNNEKLLKEINDSVELQYERMESILGVQEDKGKLFTYGGSFLAILVALATFFGFKSINEMKKGTIDAAEYEAKKIAEEKAEKVATEKAKEEVRERLDDIQKQLKNELTEEFKEKLSQHELIVSDEWKNEIISDIETRTSSIIDDLELIRSRLNQIENGSDDQTSEALKENLKIVEQVETIKEEKKVEAVDEDMTEKNKETDKPSKESKDRMFNDEDLTK